MVRQAFTTGRAGQRVVKASTRCLPRKRRWRPLFFDTGTRRTVRSLWSNDAQELSCKRKGGLLEADKLSPLACRRPPHAIRLHACASLLLWWWWWDGHKMRGIHLKSILDYPTVATQSARYVTLGWRHVSAFDMKEAYEMMIP